MGAEAGLDRSNPHPPEARARHRRCLVLRGDPDATRRQALALLAPLCPEDVLWVGADADAGPFAVTPPYAARQLLGRAFDACVIDLHGGLDADLLGQCHGFVWGGGALILRLNPTDTAPADTPDAGPGARPGRLPDRLIVFPYGPGDVGRRFEGHFERALARAERATSLGEVRREVTGTAEQAEVVAALSRVLRDRTPAVAVLMADRGRGKSSALGMAVREAVSHGVDRIAVAAGRPEAAAEVFRFAVGDPAPPAAGPVRFVVPLALALTDERFDAIVVDEAAQLPVPVLRQIVLRHPHARIAFATTTRGYEGTGRGFALRFVDWLRGAGRPLTELNLREPIRWAPGDPVERFAFDALLLDAGPAPAPPAVFADRLVAEALDRDALAADEAALREVFGLLVHAHYRTTPGDLHRLLDAPNLCVHALRHDGRVVAATLVALEGGLPAALCEDLFWGRATLRGHALADTLVAHLGHRDAGALTMVRSIRIAVHPDVRLRGLGSALVEHVHASYRPDLFGTIFGVTPGLLRFRRALGYEVARLSASRGDRTGEPAVMMLRPVSPAAVALLTTLRGELARDLPAQLEMLEAGREVLLDPALATSLRDGLPAPAPLPPHTRDELAASYAFGQRSFESVAGAVGAFAEAHAAQLPALTAVEQQLIAGRALARRPWSQVQAAAGLPSRSATMRGLRRAIRTLVLRAAPHLAALAPSAGRG